MDELLACIQMDGRVVPVDVSRTTDRVRHLLSTGEIKTLVPDVPPVEEETVSSTEHDSEEGSQDVAADPEDAQIFSQTVAQQLSNIDFALASLEEDSSQSQIIDGLYRSLVSIQNASGYMGLDEINEYVGRVAGLVDQGRSADMDFAALIDILRQERDIVWDKIDAAIITLGGVSLQELVAASWGNGQAEAGESVQTDSAQGSDASDALLSETAQESSSAPEPLVEKKTSEPKRCASASEVGSPSAASSSSTTGPNVPPTPESKMTKPSSKSPSQGNGSKAGQRAKLPSTIRVDHTKLDHLMNLIGELIINRNRFAMLARGLEDGQDVNEIAQMLSETTYSVGRISDDLQDTIMNVRMVPVQSVFSRFPRLVRDLSQKSGKQVELITEGEDTELDKSVVEEIGDPHKGNSVGIEVEDDGKGIDPKKMRAQAIRKGVITEEEARSMDDRASIELMFAPGFSTADQITDISGRGVGMDVVRNNIKNLKGSIAVQSEVGKGTRITLTLPLTLAIIDALMIKVDDAIYAIPLDAVSETTKIETARLSEVNGQKAVTLRGEVLGLVELAELLGLSCHDGKRDLLPTVVLTVNDRRLGLVVDTLLERQDVVIKSLGDYLGDLPGISGATIMGDGSVVLILDPHEIYRMATSRAGI
jgi:two-component system chemotaxis sensor kinase CheA